MKTLPKYFFYFILGLVATTARAQDNLVADTLKILDLIEKGKDNLANDPKEAIKYSMEAKQLSEEAKFGKGLALAYKNLGIANYYQGNYIDALSHYQEASDIFHSIHDESGVSNMKNNIGAIYMAQGDIVNALKNYLASLNIAESIGDTLRSLTALSNIGSVYSHFDSTLHKALEYNLRALPLAEKMGNNQAIGTIAVNLGSIYVKQNKTQEAISFFDRSIAALKGTQNEPSPYIEKGRLYLMQGNTREALSNLLKGFETASLLDNKLFMVRALQGIAETYEKKGDDKTAMKYYQQAEGYALSIEASYELMRGDSAMAAGFARLGDYKEATNYHKKYEFYKDELYNNDKDKKLATMQFDFDLQKKEGEINLLKKDGELRDLELKRQRQVKNISLAGVALLLTAAFSIYRNYRTKARNNVILEKKNYEIESLILNILPAEVADELKKNGKSSPRFYDDASVLFTDFKGFTSIADKMNPEEVITELNTCFEAFDNIIGKYKLEKIKTIGDSYMCAGGLPRPSKNHLFDMVNASLEMIEFIERYNDNRIQQNKEPMEIRIGIHTGPVAAGVVGRRKYAYDIWGSTVNVASRMESNGIPGKVNVSESVYEQIKDKFDCTYRGKIHAKNVGEIDMYLVENKAA